MSRILLAWELGHGHGHVLPLRALADELLARGHDVLIAGRDLLRVRRVFVDPRIRILAAPYFPGVIAPPSQQSALSDVIWFDAGGHSPEILTAQLLAWRELLGQLAIDLLIADAAPLALAAAPGLTRALSYGGYFHATDASAWGIFRDWERVDTAACTARARQLLLHLNQARAAAGLHPAADLATGFGSQSQLIRFLPELDYAAPRSGVRYVGQVTAGGRAPEWPEMPARKRVFAHVRKTYPGVERLLQALARQAQVLVLCFHDGLTPAQMPDAEHIVYSTEPYDMRALLPQVDAVICHGGGLQALSARHGKPLLILPMHTEQFLCARMAVKLGIALMHLDQGRPPDFLSLLQRLLGDAELSGNAQRFATQVRGRDPDAIQTVADAAARLLMQAL